jgi:predicted nucleic acid-binding protein
MRGKRFFDTNVCIYALNGDGPKTHAAKTLIARGGVVSVQVLNEYTNVARRKLKLEWASIERDIHKLTELVDEIVPLSLAAHERARRIAEKHYVQFYDGLLIASALEANCTRFISEDMQNGLIVDGLAVENPFIR